MFIRTQTTPNPASLMFLPGEAVLPDGGARTFATPREAMASPLAKRLFQVEGVASVFFGADFVTVTKAEDAAWAVLKPDVFAALTDHYAAGDPALYDAAADPAAAAHTVSPDDSEVVAMIKELLETRIRPAVQEDGGDVAFRSFDEATGTVVLKMMGACSGCPSSVRSAAPLSRRSEQKAANQPTNRSPTTPEMNQSLTNCGRNPQPENRRRSRSSRGSRAC